MGEPSAPVAEQQHLRIEQLGLALFADLGNHEMARVAGDLVLGELAVRHPRQPAIFPRVEAAGQVVQVLVAQLAAACGPRAGERVPEAHCRITGVLWSGIFSSTRISRNPRGIPIACGICPWRHSSLSRTSIIVGALVEQLARLVDIDLLNRRCAPRREYFSKSLPYAFSLLSGTDSIPLYSYNHRAARAPLGRAAYGAPSAAQHQMRFDQAAHEIQDRGGMAARRHVAKRTAHAPGRDRARKSRAPRDRRAARRTPGRVRRRYRRAA